MRPIEPSIYHIPYTRTAVPVNNSVSIHIYNGSILYYSRLLCVLVEVLVHYNYILNICIHADVCFINYLFLVHSLCVCMYIENAIANQAFKISKLITFSNLQFYYIISVQNKFMSYDEYIIMYLFKNS